MGPLFEHAHTLATLWRNRTRSRHELLAYQSRKLQSVLHFAAQRSDYYRSLYSAADTDIDSVRSSGDLHRLPLTSKAELKNVPRERWATSNPKKAAIILRTSGTSGRPFLIQRTRRENHVLGMFSRRAYREYGMGLRDITAVVAGDFPHQQSSREGRLVQALGIDRFRYVSCHQPPERIVSDLFSVAPDVVGGYPGAIGHVVQWAAQNEQAMPRPRFVLLGGETILPNVRERIGESFNAPAYGWYAAHECNLIAWECPSTGLYHICDDAVAVEIVRDGREVAEGERGEVVMTNLHCYHQPFLRYRLGDVARRGPAPCPCGQPFATLADVEGRWIDFYRLPDGRTIHHYEFVGSMLKDVQPWLVQYQMVQESVRLVVMRAVVAPDTNSSVVEAFARRMNERWGPDLRFEIEIVDELPCTPGGKFRVAHSKLGSEYDDFEWPE